MFTAEDIMAVIEKQFSRIDARFISGQEQDGVVDLTLDDAIIRVSLNQRVVRTFSITERQVAAAKDDRQLLFDTYAAPMIYEFMQELRSKCKRVVVCVQPIQRRDPDRLTVTGRDFGPRLAASSVIDRSGTYTFTIEMRFGTFNI